MGLRLWLDDKRPMPKGFDVHAKTAREAIRYLESEEVSVVSLDHDLGALHGTGYDVATYIEEKAAKRLLPRMQWHVHSANPVGAARMRAAMQSADKFWDEWDADSERD